MGSARGIRRSAVLCARVGRTVAGTDHAPLSEELGMCLSRAFAATLLAVLCAGCGGSHGDSTLPPPPTTASTSPTQTPSHDAVPAYLKGYHAKQRKAYDAALTAQAAFDRRNARILAAGQTTKAASAFYHRYSIDWVGDWQSLGQLANNHVTVTGRTKVRWARLIAIRLPGSGRRAIDCTRSPFPGRTPPSTPDLRPAPSYPGQPLRVHGRPLSSSREVPRMATKMATNTISVDKSGLHRRRSEAVLVRHQGLEPRTR